jgi:hypothetical protein
MERNEQGWGGSENDWKTSDILIARCNKEQRLPIISEVENIDQLMYIFSELETNLLLSKLNTLSETLDLIVQGLQTKHPNIRFDRYPNKVTLKRWSETDSRR